MRVRLARDVLFENYKCQEVLITRSQGVLLMVYYAYFHSIVSYGIILWGNSSYSINILRLKKKVIVIITGISNSDFFFLEITLKS